MQPSHTCNDDFHSDSESRLRARWHQVFVCAQPPPPRASSVNFVPSGEVAQNWAAYKANCREGYGIQDPSLQHGSW